MPSEPRPVLCALLLLTLLTTGCASMARYEARVRLQQSQLRARGCVTVVADADVWHSYNFDKQTPYVLDGDAVMWRCRHWVVLHNRSCIAA